ncbi:MAG TPA: aminoacetone oxidase family FAD-binding enzyme [Candidatus Limiplasma sp.]|nr:aminoacetone oxidase family FAD-binding enzyme [Candidatus Limiplasma sp.]HRX07801.1 aminoacetone oxidase family FAD-binding enzyme [Candidatus Limiplasma sp.]
MHIAVIGGGAAGFAAAIAAAQAGARVTVLERNAKPLKKLGVTGNGRGNLMNTGKPVYFGDSAFAEAVLGRLNVKELTAFFTSLGVPLREEGEALLYPASLQAASVQQAFLLRAGQLSIDIRCLARVMRITPQPGGFAVSGMQGSGPDSKRMTEEPFLLHADKVIVACGGAAYPVHGTDGTAYGLLTELGHRLTPVFPALCALTVAKKELQGLKGQRVRARLWLEDSAGHTVRQSDGEALFADDAVSGIVAMQLARFVEAGMTLCLDLRGELNLPGDSLPFVKSLADARSSLPAAELFTGAFSTPVSRLILRQAGVKDLSAPIASLGAGMLRALAQTIACVRMPVLGTRGFDAAQVTAGGIETGDFNPATMESRLVPGLYAAGEMLNVDGDCGGFNLMFAFASGLLAGAAAGEA